MIIEALTATTNAMEFVRAKNPGGIKIDIRRRVHE